MRSTTPESFRGRLFVILESSSNIDTRFRTSAFALKPCLVRNCSFFDFSSFSRSSRRMASHSLFRGSALVRTSCSFDRNQRCIRGFIQPRAILDSPSLEPKWFCIARRILENVGRSSATGYFMFIG